MRKIKARQRRKLLQQAATKLAPKSTPRTDEPKPEPKSGTLSHEKPASRVAVRYNPMTAPNSKMVDTRGKRYEIGPKGQLRRLRLQSTTRVDKIRESFRKDRKEKGKGTEGEKV